MITKSKKTSISMLRKMSILPVAFIAMYLFSCGVVSKNEVIVDCNIYVYEEEILEKPLFKGKSADEFLEWAQSEIKYPFIALENGIAGRVFTEFVIERDGSISNARTVRGVDPLLDNEAIRVISSSPKWMPGKIDGNPVRVKYSIPIDFLLASSN